MEIIVEKYIKTVIYFTNNSEIGLLCLKKIRCLMVAKVKSVFYGKYLKMKKRSFVFVLNIERDIIFSVKCIV